MAWTIGAAIAQLRGIYKLVDQDSTVTDRYLYSLIKSAADLYMRRQDSASKLMRFDDIFQSLDAEELIEVDRVQACCLDAPSGCTFRRTKRKLPAYVQGYYGPLLRNVASADLSKTCDRIAPGEFARLASQQTFRYNKRKYFWFAGGHLYFPNVDWDAVFVEGVFEFKVASCRPDVENCTLRQHSPLCVPDALFTEIKQAIRQDLGVQAQLPTDPGQDNKHPLN